MMTQKLEEKILYNARGNVYSRNIGKIYSPIAILETLPNEHNHIPLIKSVPDYNPIPIIKTANYERYTIIGQNRTNQTNNYSNHSSEFNLKKVA